MQYQRTDIISLDPYMDWNQEFTRCENQRFQSIWTLLKTLPNSSFLYFWLHLIKKNKHVRITYSKKQFKSTFGSAYLNSKKMELKLAKQVKKESFPWDLGLIFVQPMKYALNSGFIFYNRKEKSNACSLQFFFKFPCKKDDFPKAISRMLMKLFNYKI